MNQRPSLHVCIATGQNMANLIPALQYQAEEVWVLQTPWASEEKSGRHLAEAIRGRDIQCQLLDFPDHSVAAMNDQAGQLAEQLDARGQPVVINITGGTKLMTVALVQNLADMLATGDRQTVHLVYTDTASQRMHWLRPEVAEEPMQPVTRTLDVLRSYGYRIDTKNGASRTTADGSLQIAKDREQLTRKIAEHAADAAHAISMVNRYAAAAANNHGSLRQKIERMPEGSGARGKKIRDYIGWLDEAGLLAFNSAQGEIQFMSRSDAQYCAGGWLEEFVALKADRANVNGDWRSNLQVLSAEGEVPNEIDLVLVHDNRALVVECKTAKSNEEDVGNWFPKIKELAERVAGSQATPMLVSMHALNEQHCNRAVEFGVRLCHGSEVARFGGHLDRWLRDATT